MNSITFERITLTGLRKRSGLSLRDGAHTSFISPYTTATIEQVAKSREGVFHKAQRECGIQFLKEHGYKIFPRHLGIKGVKGYADFAAARYRRVILAECISDWYVESTINRKSQLIEVCELWFIAEPGGKKELAKRGYKCEKMPGFDTEEWQDLRTVFWICRPAGARSL